MNLWRRRAAAALALMCVVALAGCGGEDEPADETVDETEVDEPDVDEPDVDEPGGGKDDDADDDGVSDDAAVIDAWSTRAGNAGDEPEFDFDCPGGGSLDWGIWGGEDGQYTDDSSICVAAVHAGLITAPDGGTVHVTLTPGLDTYGDGFAANGVTSQAWTDPWSGSFEVSAG